MNSFDFLFKKENSSSKTCKLDSQQPTSRNSGPAQSRNQQVEESLSINSHSDSCIGVK